MRQVCSKCHFFAPFVQIDGVGLCYVCYRFWIMKANPEKASKCIYEIRDYIEAMEKIGLYLPTDKKESIEEALNEIESKQANQRTDTRDLRF